MVLREWGHYSDLRIIEMGINAGYFRHWISPRSPDLDTIKRYMIIAPHQDDEVIGCGGLMLKLKKNGAESMVVFTTNGEQNNLGVSLRESVLLRKKEAEKALNRIEPQIKYLGVNNSNPDIDKDTIERLAKLIDEFNPQFILHPWVLDPPVKHRISNVLLFFALKNSEFNGDIWGYQVHSQLFCNICIPVDEELDLKMEMIRSYTSQLRHVAPYDHYALGMAILNAKMSGDTSIRYAESFFGLESSSYNSLMNTVVIKNLDNYLRNEKWVTKLSPFNYD